MENEPPDKLLPFAEAPFRVRAAGPDVMSLPPILRTGVPRHLRKRMRRPQQAPQNPEPLPSQAAATSKPKRVPAKSSPIARGAETPAAVYLLLHRSEPRFKLGWSLNPSRRILDLPEHEADELDLNASLVAWMPSRSRAEQVERSMHKLLRPNAVTLNHSGDGHTEWFQARAWDRAIRLLQQVSVNGDTRLVQLQSFGNAAQDAPVVALDGNKTQDPQVVWQHIEDLLLRLVQHVPVQLLLEQAPRVSFIGLRRAWPEGHGPLGLIGARDCHLAKLRWVVMTAETYQFRRQGRLHSFLQWLDYEGDDLLLQFVNLDNLETWDAEVHLPTQVKALLQRLVLLSPPPPESSAAGAPRAGGV